MSNGIFLLVGVFGIVIQCKHSTLESKNIKQMLDTSNWAIRILQKLVWQLRMQWVMNSIYDVYCFSVSQQL